MIRTQVYIPDDIYHEAKRLSQIENTNISQILREGLFISIEKRRKKERKKKPLSTLVGAIKAQGHIDAAINHNDIYE